MLIDGCDPLLTRCPHALTFTLDLACLLSLMTITLLSSTSCLFCLHVLSASQTELFFPSSQHLYPWSGGCLFPLLWGLGPVTEVHLFSLHCTTPALLPPSWLCPTEQQSPESSHVSCQLFVRAANHGFPERFPEGHKGQYMDQYVPVLPLCLRHSPAVCVVKINLLPSERVAGWMVGQVSLST